jgi:hypothetical protein
MKARALLPVLAATVLVALLLPGAASAKPGFRKLPPVHILQLFPAHGTNGYSVSIDVLDGRPRLTAVRQAGPETSIVLYRQTKRRDIGNDLDADFGKAGRLKARFVPQKVVEVKAPKDCVGDPIVAQSGYFVGRLTFHGEGDFTSFQAHRLRGAATRYGSWTCRADPGASSIEMGGVGRAITGLPSGGTRFEAVTEPARPGFPATSTYGAITDHREGSVDILQSVVVPAPAPLAIPDLTKALPATVTIEPPAPFSGSATIEAASRATATLNGDLSVDFPAAGDVHLTGPGVAAGLCRDYTCTKSLPKALTPQSPRSGLGLLVDRVEFQTIR